MAAALPHALYNTGKAPTEPARKKWTREGQRRDTMSTMNERRKYDDEFKKDAVQLLINSGRSIKDVAEELGLERSNLGRWRLTYLRELDQGTPTAGITPSELEKENRRLRKELAYVQEQRDILKKACGILSDRPGRSMP